MSEQVPELGPQESDLDAAEAGQERVPGSARGLFVVPDNFDAPLDEEFRDHL